MKFHAALIAAFVTLTGAAADAALLRLTYTGHDLPLVTPPPDFLGPLHPAFSGEIVLDEGALGGSVAGRTLTFFGIDAPSSPFDQTDGILSWTHGVPLYSVGGTDVSISFDAGKKVIAWVFDALDGPPDYVSSTRGDSVLGGAGGIYATGPGSWVTAQVPLPAPGLMLAAAMGALRGRRSR